MTRVLFVCRQNAGRSQISEALLRLAVDGRHEARSAGTTPASAHPSSAASSTSSQRASLPSSDQILAMAGRE